MSYTKKKKIVSQYLPQPTIPNGIFLIKFTWISKKSKVPRRNIYKNNNNTICQPIYVTSYRSMFCFILHTRVHILYTYINISRVFIFRPPFATAAPKHLSLSPARHISIAAVPASPGGILEHLRAVKRP